MKNNTVSELSMDINDVIEENNYITGIKSSNKITTERGYSGQKPFHMSAIITEEQLRALKGLYSRQSTQDNGRYVSFFPALQHFHTLNHCISAIRISRECYGHEGVFFCQIAQYEKKNSHRVPVLLIYPSYLDRTPYGLYWLFSSVTDRRLILSLPGIMS